MLSPSLLHLACISGKKRKHSESACPWRYEFIYHHEYDDSTVKDEKRYAMMEYLLDKVLSEPCDGGFTDREGLTPLAYAVIAKDFKMTK